MPYLQGGRNTCLKINTSLQWLKLPLSKCWYLCDRRPPRVLMLCVKSIRTYKEKSSSTFFSDDIQWNFKTEQMLISLWFRPLRHGSSARCLTVMESCETTPLIGKICQFFSHFFNLQFQFLSWRDNSADRKDFSIDNFFFVTFQFSISIFVMERHPRW